MSMLDVVNEHFTHDKVKVHLLKFACEMLVGPDEKGTGTIIFNMPGFVHAYPPGVPVGGSVALVDALARCLRHHGGEIRSETTVTRILTSARRAVGVRLADGEEIRARTAVIGQIHPWLLGDMVDGIDEHVARTARNTKSASFSIMAAHFALREPPRFKAGAEPARVALANFAPATLEGYMRIFDDIRYGELPSRPIFASHNNAQWDPSRAPAGGGALTVFGFGPWALRDGGADAWDARKPELARWLRDTYAGFCENLDDDNIVAWRFDTPKDLARHSPTFQHGDVGGVGKYFFQIGGHRPTPELAQYAVPGIERLYLAGTFMHPPGGVTGGGRATALRICGDLDIDFDSLCEA
jgi:phytoene dehydrogenase-like protein